MGFKVYDPDQVTVNIAGFDIAGGYGDDEFCKIVQNEDDFSMVVGTDGEVTRSKTNRGDGEITLTLMQSSSSNALLSGLRAADLLAPNGAGVGPCLIRDRQGTSLFASAHCWVGKPPDVTYMRGASVRQWKIMYADHARVDGGN